MVNPVPLNCMALLAKDFEEWMGSYKWSWNQKFGGEVTPIHQSPIQSRATSSLPSPPASPLSSTSRRSHKQAVFTPATLSPSSSSSSSLPPLHIADSPTSKVLFTTKYFEVWPSDKRGLGAFATRDIEKDTVIMEEKPLFKCQFNSIHYIYEQLTEKQTHEYLSLSCYCELNQHKVAAIFMTNRFEISQAVGGIFLKSSRFNHACPEFRNCSYTYDETKDMLITRACRDIAKGQELTISYASQPNHLFDDYGFFCDCPACPDPKIAEANERIMRGY